jgi:hypothetical protein
MKYAQDVDISASLYPGTQFGSGHTRGSEHLGRTARSDNQFQDASRAPEPFRKFQRRPWKQLGVILGDILKDVFEPPL